MKRGRVEEEGPAKKTSPKHVISVRIDTTVGLKKIIHHAYSAQPSLAQLTRPRSGKWSPRPKRENGNCCLLVGMMYALSVKKNLKK